MICARCAHAADQQAPRDQHCDSTGGPGARCDCAHRTDLYAVKPPAETRTPFAGAANGLDTPGN